MRWPDRLKNRTDTEHEQGLLRVIIITAAIAYGYYCYRFYASDKENHYIALIAGTGFLLFSFILLAHIVIFPVASPVRRVVGMLTDLTSVSIIMHLEGEYGAILSFIYLWVCVGNGLRYGTRYLYAGMAVSITAYITMVATTPYWREQIFAAAGFLICLIVLPLFYSVLLKKNEKTHEELSLLAEKLRNIANHDTLTGLPNRHSFHETLEQMLVAAESDKSNLAIMFIDLDGFKPINDTYGHSCGDEVLIATSSRLKHSLRKGDFIARLGGDEFVLLLTNISKEEVHVVARKIVAIVATPIVTDCATMKVTSSLGIAFFPDNAQTVKALLARADAAMYKSKRTGKNGYCIAGDQESCDGDFLSPCAV